MNKKIKRLIAEGKVEALDYDERGVYSAKMKHVYYKLTREGAKGMGYKYNHTPVTTLDPNYLHQYGLNTCLAGLYFAFRDRFYIELETPARRLGLYTPDGIVRLTDPMTDKQSQIIVEFEHRKEIGQTISKINGSDDFDLTKLNCNEHAKILYVWCSKGINTVRLYETLNPKENNYNPESYWTLLKRAEKFNPHKYRFVTLNDMIGFKNIVDSPGKRKVKLI